MAANSEVSALNKDKSPAHNHQEFFAATRHQAEYA
jgi:hypothetical protein